MNGKANQSVNPMNPSSDICAEPLSCYLALRREGQA